MQSLVGRVLLFVLAVAVLSSACVQRPGRSAVVGDSSISGTVVGVSGATVHVYKLSSTNTPLFEEGQGTTGVDGSFSIPFSLIEGPFLIVATGGTKLDAATGAAVHVVKDQSALVPS